MKKNKNCGYYKFSIGDNTTYVKIISVLYKSDPFVGLLLSTLTNTISIVQRENGKFIKSIQYHEYVETNLDSPLSIYPAAKKIDRNEYLEIINSINLKNILYDRDIELLEELQMDEKM